ncbi:MAG: D-2-hydroxyacid dehydrogenase, partial [Gammaproteobacteria bacterium]
MKTVFLDFDTVDNNDIDIESLRGSGVELTLYGVTPCDLVASRIAEAEIVITNKLQLGRAELLQAQRLRLICLVATGTNNIDLAAAAEKGIGVCNIVGYCTASVVQHVWALILSLTQHLRDYEQLLKGGSWRDSAQFCMLDFPIRELDGKTLGIVGYGELGRAVARIGVAFGMQIVVAQRPGEQAVEAGEVNRQPLAKLLAQSDIVSLHCPLTEETRGLISRAELELMKPDALLINTARGGLVDPGALADALHQGRIGGAGIDVLTQEPPANGDPLLAGDIPNLIVTPHIAWAARTAR